MPDAARVAQAQALEVPVILQGAKTADGTDRRELFTENATTTLVFDNGAVLNLRSKLAIGQVIFLHNTQNKREILCKVLEAPPEGQAGHTELEFTTAAPGFWVDVAEQPVASGQNPEPSAEPILHSVTPQEPLQEPAEESSENSLTMMSTTASAVKMPPTREELVPAYEAVPETAAAAPVSPPPEELSVPTGEQIDAALRTISDAPAPPHSPEIAGASSHPQDATEPNDPKLEQHLAALMAREARLAKYAAAKENQAGKNQRGATSRGALEDAATNDGESEPATVAIKAPLSERLTTGKGAIIVTIAACVMIVVALDLIWQAMRPAFVHDNAAPHAAAAQTKPKAPPATPPPARGAASAVAGVPPAAAGASSKAAQPLVAQSTAVAVTKPQQDAKVVPAAPAAAVRERGSNAVEFIPAPSADAKDANRDGLESDAAGEQPKPRKPAEAAAGDIPARILSQPQPAFPDWAKSLDVDAVVKLDAVIDEKGNVTETTVLSGPRQLQHAAEQAVGLWIFEAAQSAGKPTASHMVLTVEFQR